MNDEFRSISCDSEGILRYKVVAGLNHWLYYRRFIEIQFPTDYYVCLRMMGRPVDEFSDVKKALCRKLKKLGQELLQEVQANHVVLGSSVVHKVKQLISEYQSVIEGEVASITSVQTIERRREHSLETLIREEQILEEERAEWSGMEI